MNTIGFGTFTLLPEHINRGNQDTSSPNGESFASSFDEILNDILPEADVNMEILASTPGIASLAATIFSHYNPTSVQPAGIPLPSSSRTNADYQLTNGNPTVTSLILDDGARNAQVLNNPDGLVTTAQGGLAFCLQTQLIKGITADSQGAKDNSPNDVKPVIGELQPKVHKRTAVDIINFSEIGSASKELMAITSGADIEPVPTLVSRTERWSNPGELHQPITDSIDAVEFLMDDSSVGGSNIDTTSNKYSGLGGQASAVSVESIDMVNWSVKPSLSASETFSVSETLNTNTETSNVINQIVEHAKIISRPNNTEMVIKLVPEHLGELTLQVTFNDSDGINAVFYANNPETRNILEASVLQLKQELQNQGIKVDFVGVYTGLSNFSSQEQRENSPHTAPKPTIRRLSSVNDSEEITEIDYNRAVLTSFGGEVDYKI